jgi:outer membrane receptor protein involved in Fe transport
MGGKRMLAATAALMGATALSAQALPDRADADGEIIVTATRRPSLASDVPIALSAVSARQMQDSGARDIRQLNQLVPSLLVSSTSSEAGGGGARIRGIGTVGDNAGLESSVATFVDGVYRSRAGVALTELGPLERVEVLRGPQGTLFGRNAAAGLINIVTANPRFTQQGYGETSVGNYDLRRLAAGLTGPVSDTLAYRIDGVWTDRRGFVTDVVSGRHLQNRDRWLARGKVLFQPHAGLSLLLSADYSRRNEECCGGVYRPAADVVSSTPGQPGGTPVYRPSSIAALIRNTPSAIPGATGQVREDTFAREVALTPGRSFRQDVSDYGLSSELNLDLGSTHLTAITAWRGNRFTKGQDADFSSLDLLVRPSDGSGFTRFRTLTQEVRLQGKAFDDRIDWLVGGYFANERLTYVDNQGFGADFETFAAARMAAAGGAFADFARYGFGDLTGFARAFASGRTANPAAVDAVAAQVGNVALDGTGERDRFRQRDRNLALFTHNIVALSDRVSLTLGARYTDDRKTLAADLASNSGCGAYAANITRLRALAAGGGDPAAAVATALAAQLAPYTGFACVVSGVNGRFTDRRHETEWTGTAALSWKPAPGLLAYASVSRGYKAGGFNLDRAALYNTATLTQRPFSSLQFEPETVDAWEVGAKFARRDVTLSAVLFYERFRNFQLNTYNGLNFFVSNVQGCRDALAGRDSDAVAGNSSCADTRSGVAAKGIELEASLRPLRDVALTAGFTYADTRYRHDLVGSPDPETGDNSLQPALFLLPGSRLSNAPAAVATGSAGWTPAVGAQLKALVYADIRYTSRIHTGSDLLPEKDQSGVALVNARIGIGRADARWTLELWAQNLFDADYIQTGFSMPLQGGGTGGVPGSVASVRAFGTSSTQLFGAFPGEPRTWGLTARTTF